MNAIRLSLKQSQSFGFVGCSRKEIGVGLIPLIYDQG